MALSLTLVILFILSMRFNVFCDLTNYLYVSDAVVWDEAGNRCEDMGYILATPKDEIENKHLLEYLETKTGRTDEIWIGGYLDALETWRWIFGPEIQVFDWSVENRQPNDIDREKCIRIRMDDKLWWNRECHRAFPFVCQIDSVREASFSLLERDKIPQESPLKEFHVTSAPECTLRCMAERACKLYSVQMTSTEPARQYLCQIFTSGPEEVVLQEIDNARLYSRQT